MANGPDFTNLGVTDPTTGKPVYLSANEIATVMGATGGVAPSGFQAGVEGLLKGVEAGTAFSVNQSNMAAQGARTDAQQIQNEINQRTKEAQILTKSNEIAQQGIEAKIKTQKLNQDNQVWTGLQSGDAETITKMLESPDLRLATLEKESYINASLAGVQLTPQQQVRLDNFRNVSNIYKAGDVQSQYQTAGKAIRGLPEVLALSQQTGLPPDQVIAQMQPELIPRSGPGEPMDPGGMALSLNGKSVRLPEKDADATNKRLLDFFPVREALLKPGELKLPQFYGPATGAPTQQTGAPAVTQQTAASTAQTSDPLAAQGAAALPGASPTPTPTSTPQPSLITNPNGVSPLGVPLQTNAPQLQALNKKTTVDGNPLVGTIQRKAQEIFATNRDLTPKQALDQATKEVMRKAVIAPKVKGATEDSSTLANNKRIMAQEIIEAVNLAKAAKLNLGPTMLEKGSRGVSLGWSSLDSLGQGLNEATGVAAKPVDDLDALSSIYSRFDNLSARYGQQVAQSSGMGTLMYNSDKDQERLEKQGPTIRANDDQNLAVAARLLGEANYIDDENTIAQTLSGLDLDFAQIKDFVNRYHQENPALIFDEATGRAGVNSKRTSARTWVNKQLGVDDNAEVQNTFSTPTALPKATTEQQAPASGGPAPFETPKKENASPFPTATPDPNVKGVSYDRGANYNETPATLKDLKATAETAAAGGNLRAFMQSGSVPLKLDKATPDLMARLVSNESKPGKTPGSVNPNSTSPTGVKGLAQVTQDTFGDMAKLKDPDLAMSLTDRTNPTESIVAGTKRLNQMLKRYDGNVDLSLAAYNAGPGVVDNALEAAGASTNRATIDTIAPYLPTGINPATGKKYDNTAAYVKRITTRGRVAPQTQLASNTPQQKGGFFSMENLNPLSATTAEAEEFNPQDQKPIQETDIIPPLEGPTLDAEGNPTGEYNISIKGTGDSQPKPTEVDPDAPMTATVVPEEGGGGVAATDGVGGVTLPDGVSLPGPTTDPVAKVEKMDNAPRGNVPPVSEILTTLSTAKPKEGGSGIDITGAAPAVEFIRNSAIGRFLGEIATTRGFKAAETAVNGALFGFYNEGLGAIEGAMGFDGALMQKTVKEELQQFHHDNPRLAVFSDIFGSVAGGWGGGVMLKALGMAKKAATAGKLFSKTAPMSIKEGTKAAVTQMTARGVGDSEGSLGDRVTGGLKGAATGLVIGPAAGLLNKVPVVGSPALVGGMGGAGYGVLTGEDAAGIVKDAAIGAAGLATTAGATRVVSAYAPIVQKAIAKAVVQLNDQKALQALGSMLQKVLTGKSSSEQVANLSDLDAYWIKMLQHSNTKEVLGFIKALKAAKKSNPKLKLGALDIIENADAKTVIKLVRQMGEYPEVGVKASKFITARQMGRADRVADELGDFSDIAAAGKQVIDVIGKAAKGTRSAAAATGEGAYSKAKATTPKFVSDKIKEILSIPAVKRAANKAKADIEDVQTTSTKQYTAKDLNTLVKGSGKTGDAADKLANQLVERINKGEPIDDLLNPDQVLKENSFEVLKRVTMGGGTLDTEIEAAATTTAKRYLVKIKDALIEEMRRLNPELKAADEAYAKTLATVDTLGTKEIEAITDLANGGNLEAAIPKFMKLSTDKLQSVLDSIQSTPAGQAAIQKNPTVFKDAAKAYFLSKLKPAVDGKNVAKSLITKGEEANARLLLGDDEFNSLMTKVQTESQAARTESALGAGSDTITKAKGQDALDLIAGKNSDVAGALSKGVSGDWKFALAGYIRAGLRAKGLWTKGDPKKVDAMVESVLLNANKGIAQMESVLKARGLSQREVLELGPQIEEWQRIFRAGGMGLPTSFVGQATAHRTSKKPTKAKK